MDGNTLNTSQFALKKWLVQAIGTNRVSDPPTTHLNQLTSDKMTSLDMIELSCLLYEMMIDSVMTLESELMPYLIIPLSFSNTLDVTAPSLADVEQDCRVRQSPTFYLLRREMSQYLFPIEKYVSPVDYGLFQRYPKNIYMHYCISRGADAIKNDLEYDRNISVEYYPDILL